VNPCAFHRISVIVGAVVFSLVTQPASSDALLSLNIAEPIRTGPSNASYSFAGLITNKTGRDLSTADLFLDFNAFDPSTSSFEQLLGGVSLLITSGGTSAQLDLFDFNLGAGNVGAVYSVEVTLQDAGLAISDPVFISIRVIPEVECAKTMLAGLLLAFVALSCRRPLPGERQLREREPTGPAAERR